MAQAERTGARADRRLNFTPGFPAADVAECGPAVFAYGATLRTSTRRLQTSRRSIAEREREFALDVHSIEAALRELARTPRVGRRPIMLADTQDNPGGGGTANTTSLLKALIERRTAARARRRPVRSAAAARGACSRRRR